MVRESNLVRSIGNGSVEPYSLLLGIVESRSSMLKRLPPMLDNPEKTAHLLAALKAAVPFEVELPPMVIKQLQADKVADGHQARQTVSELIVSRRRRRDHVSYRSAGRRSGDHYLADPRSGLSFHTAGRIHPQLSEASSEEAKEAGPLAVIVLPPAERVSAISVLRNEMRELSISVRPCLYVMLWCMTKLLEEAIDRLRQFPEAMQDAAARALIMQLEEEPEPGDREAMAAGWNEYQRGEYVTLDQLRHEMGPGGR